MVETVIKTIISLVVSGLFGYLIGRIKDYKKKLYNKKESEKQVINEIKTLKEDQLLEMRNDLSNKFFVYDAMTEVEDYLVMSFREKCERYFSYGGDSWIHPMYDKSFNWKIKPTAYLS